MQTPIEETSKCQRVSNICMHTNNFDMVEWHNHCNVVRTTSFANFREPFEGDCSEHMQKHDVSIGFVTQLGTAATDFAHHLKHH